MKLIRDIIVVGVVVGMLLLLNALAQLEEFMKKGYVEK